MEPEKILCPKVGGCCRGAVAERGWGAQRQLLGRQAGALRAWLKGLWGLVLEPRDMCMYSWRPVSPQGRDSVLTCNQQQLSHRSTWNKAGDFIYRKFSVDFSFSKRERLEQKTTKKKRKKTMSERNFLGSARSKGGSAKGVLSGWDSG